MEYFKYLSPRRIDVLENLKIRYTQAFSQNDPFESFPGIVQKSKDWYKRSFLRNVEAEADALGIKSINKRKRYIRSRKKDFENYYKCYSDHDWLMEQSESVILMDSVVQGCLSMSEINNNILMWSHYAQNHEGFVIGFDSDHEYFNYGVEPVVYSDKRPFLDPTQPNQDASIFYTKSNDWSYEKEIRKIQNFIEPVVLENGNSFISYPEEVPSKYDPRLSEIKLFEFPKESISSVVLGWKSTEELKSRIVEVLRKNEMNDVSLLKACPHKYKYEMVIEKI